METEYKAWLDNIKIITSLYQAILTECYQKNTSDYKYISLEKIQKLTNLIVEQLNSNPEIFANLNLKYAQELTTLITNIFMRLCGTSVPVIFNTPIYDKRFQDQTWDNNVYFCFLKQFYVLTSNLILSYVDYFNLDRYSKKLIYFFVKQFINAFAPSNFPLTNPSVLKESINTNLENIKQGFENLLQDIKNSKNIFQIKTSDSIFFKLGQNIAATKGKVIYKNDLIELISYTPISSKTHSIPILIVPPCINKYYILDLSQENSFTKWLVDNHYQVFMLSWVNPDQHLAHKDLENYINEGILQVCDFLKSYHYQKIDAIGYCIGGTFLAIALAYMQNTNNNFIRKAAFFTTLLDFNNPGDIEIFINEDTLEFIQTETQNKGFFDGKYLSQSFSLLRANDLVWSFVINNYLLGKKPLPLDFLYWNADSSNLPARMYNFYIKNFYIENNLIIPNKLEILGVKINLQNITNDLFFLACKDDHIALADSVFNGLKHIGGNKTFCLTSSGHVAGVINPPVKNKYSYTITQNLDHFPSSNTQIETKGSWWPELIQWLTADSSVLTDHKYHDLPKSYSAPGQYLIQNN